jgi:nucleotide-binding universal stress UspA family protein
MHGLERGDAAEVLLETARDAELLVLGNHGRGALAATLVDASAPADRHLRCGSPADTPVTGRS